MSYRYEIPALLDRLLEDLFEDNYETYEDGYVLPLVLDEDAPRPVTYRAMFDGVQCHACGRIYTLDLYVDDRVWQIIRPNVSTEGLLCPACIGDRLERAFREGKLRGITHGVIELRK